MSELQDYAIAQRFQKRPVIVDAIQWDGSAERATPIIDWILDGDGTARYHGAGEVYGGGEEEHPKLAIDTLEGTMWASPADWIIRGVNGEFYPCKPDIFEKSYLPLARLP